MAQQHAGQVAVSGQRQAWIRAAQPAPWTPWAIFGAILFLLALLYAVIITARGVQQQTAAAVSDVMSRAGIRGAIASGDGQEVLVKGEYAGDLSQETLRAAGHGTKCDVAVFGDLVCPTEVELALQKKAVAAKSPPKALPRPHDFRITWSGQKAVLTGEVASDAQRAAYVKKAQETFSDAEVVDQLSVSGSDSLPGQSPAFGRGLAVLSRIADGYAEWKGNKLSVYGNAKADDKAQAEAVFRGADGPPLGEIVLQSTEQIDKCEQDFANALKQSKINFATGRAEISAQSQGVLAQLAKVAARCPGTLVIEGHTDNVGKADANLALSTARAQAVVDALSGLEVERDRMKAKGFGPDRPISNNRSAQGRARNRRIEVHIERNEF